MAGGHELRGEAEELGFFNVKKKRLKGKYFYSCVLLPDGMGQRRWSGGTW